MSPSEIIRRAIEDHAVVLIEGEHDGIGEAALDALAADGWEVVRLELAQDRNAGEALYRIVERAR